MRTTLTLDDDVAAKLRQLAARRRLSFKEAVNSVLRRGLAAQEVKGRSAQPFRVPVFRSAFRPGVDPLRLNQLVDELATEEFARVARPRSDGHT
jgi:Ribbon-helix-helix protein, copG family